ncbi:transporter, major facilitator family protein, partial [Cardiosporidium cionae]
GGRKNACMLYCILTSISCLFYNWKSFYILCVSRVIAAAASSLLWSGFDAWLLCEHDIIHHFPSNKLPSIYSLCAFGNGIIAVCAGIVSSFATRYFGPTGPFNLSVCFAMACCAFIAFTWTENYGKQYNNRPHSFRTALTSSICAFMERPEILLGGIVQSLFEGVTHLFVLFWTPSLPQSLDRGLVFSCFMASLMLGTRISNFLPKHWRMLVYQIYGYLALGSTAIILGSMTSGRIRFLFFCIYEFCVGMHWSSFYSIRITRFHFEDVKDVAYLFFILFLGKEYPPVWSSISMDSLMIFCSMTLVVALIVFSVVHRKIAHCLDEELNSPLIADVKKQSFESTKNSDE